MRLGIRAKQIAGVTAIVGVTVVALSALHMARLADVIVGESHTRAQVLARTILHRIGELPIDPAKPYDVLRSDSGLATILDASIYDEAVTDASILDASGVIVMDLEDKEALVGVVVNDGLRVVVEGIGRGGRTLPCKVEGKEIGKYRLHRARKGCLLPVKMKPAFIL